MTKTSDVNFVKTLEVWIDVDADVEVDVGVGSARGPPQQRRRPGASGRATDGMAARSRCRWTLAP